MKFVTSIVQNSKKYVKKVGVKAMEKSPELMLVGGIGCIIFGSYLLCKKGADVKEALVEHVDAKEEAVEYHNLVLEDLSGAEESDVNEDIQELVVAENKDYRKKLVKVYRDTTLNVTKNLAPGVAFEVIGIALILGSYGIMKRRSACLMAAYEGLSTTFAAYRDRVRDSIGEEREADIWNGRVSKVITEEIVDPETGKKKKVKREVQQASHPNVGWIFDREHSSKAEDSYIYNLEWLERMQSVINDGLKGYGTDSVFLGNDFADTFGFDRWPEGCVMGIRYGAETDKNGNPKKFDLGLWTEEVWDDLTMTTKRTIHLNPNFDVEPVWQFVGCKTM